MEHATETPADQQRGRAAAWRTSQAGSTVEFFDNRTEVVSQRELHDAIDRSPRVAAQRQLIAHMQDSPKSVAQRLELRGMFGDVSRLRGESEGEGRVSGQQPHRAGSAGLLQRQKGLKENDPVWLIEESDVRLEGRLAEVLNDNTYVVDVAGHGLTTSDEKWVEHRKDNRRLFRHDRGHQAQYLGAIENAITILRKLGESLGPPQQDADLLGSLWDVLAGIPFKFGRANLEAAFPDNKLARLITKMGFANLVRELGAKGGVQAMTQLGHLARLKAEIVGQLPPILGVFQMHQMKTPYSDESGEPPTDYSRLEASVRERQVEIQRIKSAGMSEAEIGLLQQEIENKYAKTDEELNRLTKQERFVRQDIEAEKRHEVNRLLSPQEVPAIEDEAEREFQTFRFDVKDVPLEKKKERLEALKLQLKETSTNSKELEKVRGELRYLKRDIEAIEAFAKSALRPDTEHLWEQIGKLTHEINRRNRRKAEIGRELQTPSQPASETGAASSSTAKKSQSSKIGELKRESGQLDNENKKDQAQIESIKKKHVGIDIEFEAYRLTRTKLSLSGKESELAGVQQLIGPVDRYHNYLTGVRTSGLDSATVLEETLIDARKSAESAKADIISKAEKNAATYTEKIKSLSPGLSALLEKRVPLIVQALKSKGHDLPAIRDTGETNPLKLSYTYWAVYRKAAIELNLIEPKVAEDEQISRDYRTMGQAASALADIPESRQKDLERADAGWRILEERLAQVKGYRSRATELPRLESELRPLADFLASMTQAQSAASKVALEELQKYQLDFESRKIVDLLREFQADIEAAGATPEQLLVLSNFSGFMGERSSSELLERLDKVLPAGFRGALKDLRNRAMHLFDTHTLDILKDTTITSAVASAAKALHQQLAELMLQGDFLAGRTKDVPVRSSSSDSVFTAINGAAQALPRIQLDFDVSGGPKPPEKAGQAAIFETALEASPPLMKEIAELISSWSLSIGDVVALFDERSQGAVTEETRKRRLQIESRLQALGQTLGNLQQLDETLTELASLRLKVGQHPGFELLQQFIAAIKEFRSARTHGGFTNVPALRDALKVILEDSQPISAAMRGLRGLGSRAYTL